MSNYDGATIEILNWEKYNPKRDQKTYTWLRLDNGISTDPDLFGLDAEQKFVWIEILCQASKKNDCCIKLNIGYLEHITGVKKSKIEALIEFLLDKPMITLQESSRPRAVVSGRDHDNTRSCEPESTTPTYVRTNERDERTNERESQSRTSALPPLVEIWNEFSDQRLPKVREMSKKSERYRSCTSRWQEKPDPDFWKSVIDKINQSKFCLGDNPRGWRANIGFLIRPDRCHEILEGKYDNPNSTDDSYWQKVFAEEAS